MNQDPYFGRSEVSNSDLHDLHRMLYGGNDRDPTDAYRFGTLIDAMVTEPEVVDFFKRTCHGEQYTAEEFRIGIKMRDAFRKDKIAAQIIPLCTFQQVFNGPVKLKYGNSEFSIPMRCKYDLWMPSLGYGGDIKSTTATTQKQFEEACRFFDYDQQRAVYMSQSGAKHDVLIGISKVNYKVFKLFINRGDAFFNSGMQKFTDIAFKWWELIGDSCNDQSNPNH